MFSLLLSPRALCAGDLPYSASGKRMEYSVGNPPIRFFCTFDGIETIRNRSTTLSASASVELYVDSSVLEYCICRIIVTNFCSRSEVEWGTHYEDTKAQVAGSIHTWMSFTCLILLDHNISATYRDSSTRHHNANCELLVCVKRSSSKVRRVFDVLRSNSNIPWKR